MQLHTIDDLTKILKLSRSHIYNLLDNGDLPSIKIGKSRRISDDDLARFVEQHRVT